MALTNDDLYAISQLLDNKLTPIHHRLDKLEGRLDNIDDRLGSIDDRLGSIDDRLGGIDDRLDKIDDRLDITAMKQNLTSKKLDDLKLDVNIAERDIRRDIHKLNDEMETIVETLKQHELLSL